MPKIRKANSEPEDISKDAIIAQLKLIRSKFPDKVTTEEVGLLKKLYYTRDANEDFNTECITTIKRTETPEQIVNLIDEVGGACNYRLWYSIYHNLEDNEKDRKLGKNIIKAVPKSQICSSYYSDEMLGFYNYLMRLNEKGGQQPLVLDSEMATEILKTVNELFKYNLERDKECNYREHYDFIMRTRRFLHPPYGKDEYAWDGINAIMRKNKDDSALKRSYIQLFNTMHNAENDLKNHNLIEDSEWAEKNGVSLPEGLNARNIQSTQRS